MRSETPHGEERGMQASVRSLRKLGCARLEPCGRWMRNDHDWPRPENALEADRAGQAADGLESVKKTHQVAPHSGARRPARFCNSDPATSTRHQLDQTSI
jgi:hypothetical protein